MNLRPPGYELRKVVFSVAALRVLALFHGKPEGHNPFRTTLSTRCYPSMGQRMGQATRHTDRSICRTTVRRHHPMSPDRS